jgi:alkylation response protein AidB-like acyl-CoA dehydrogenase
MVDAANLAGTLHPPARKALLAELGRRDPSLAYRVAAHLWARDVAQLHPLSPVLIQAAELWTRGEEWACFAVPDVMQSDGGGWAGEATFVPAAGAKSLLLLLGGRLTLVPVATPGVQVETLQTLGLRGAGLCRVRLDHLVVPENSVTADHDRVERVWQVLSSADLTAIAFGMADILCARAVAHAATRVQFPGLFQDEEARDPIGKFGAVKKMVAEIAARRYLLETLDHSLSPANFSGSSVELAGLVKALAAEALCSGLDSVTYNAGQVFGGTGYSEDDILSKFYRDAAAWRFLGTGNGKVYRLHGEHLLRTWNSDGRRLPSLPNEGVLFDQLVQRNSLQAELDEARVLRARLRGLINAWIDGRKSRNGTPRSDEGYVAGPAVAEVMEGTARQSAMLLAAKAMVLRTHARLEENIESETEIALLRVWLGSAVASLEKLEAGVHELVDSMEREALRPIADPRQPGMPATYSEYLSAQVTYDSGDFLVFGVNPLAPRFVPDMVISDPVLAGRDREIRSLIDGHFGPSRGLGVPYERYIEARHRPDEQDLDFCRQHGFFRMTIPRELGGEGRQKVDYYLLTTNAQRYADVAISLTIQVNASIGTTPIFLARDKDLPKAQSELGIFVGDPALQQEVEIKLLRLIDLTNTGTATRVQRGYGELQQRLEETVLARGTLRALASRFVTEWQ